MRVFPSSIHLPAPVTLLGADAATVLAAPGFSGRDDEVVPQAAACDAPEVAAPARRAQAAPRISCVLPCRNEAQNLGLLLPRLLAVLRQLTPEWEVIIVDDGSSDGTPLALAAWARVPGVRGIQLSRNFGKEAALTAGLEATRGDVVVTMDADLQHEPELIPALLEPWRDGADAAYAVRSSRSDEGLLKRVGSRCFYAIVNAAHRFEVPADAGDFRLMDRSVVDALLALPERNRFMKGLYAWVGFDAVAVPYLPDERAHGTSHFSKRRLIRFGIDGLTAFSVWPLRAVIGLGFVLALAAFGYGAYLTLEYFLHGHEVGGWTTIVVSLMLFVGIQLVSLGVVAEYVGRIYEEVKCRPLYLVKRELGRGLRDEA